jgi:hypothetical protein
VFQQSSSSDEEQASAVRGQPDIILMRLAAAMDAARKHMMLRRSGTAARSPGSVLTATCVAKKLRAAYTQTLFSRRARQNPYGGTVPTFTGAESERRLRVNAGVYDRVKASDDLLQILTRCCILHNMTIEDTEEYSEDNIAGTRNTYIL